MTFDPNSLLRPPPAPPVVRKPLNVDELAAELLRISALGMGQTLLALPDGQSVNAVELVAVGEVAAYFVVTHK